ncbi:MAG: histidine phosphatase family protein [Cyanobacteria bacterium P01_D01_bin.1]
MTYLKLALIRHAESIGNTQKIMEGQSSTPLSANGLLQAQQLRDALSTCSIAHPRSAQRSQKERSKTEHSKIEHSSFLYSSPLLRAAQTADILAEALDHSQRRRSSDLQEMHQGIFQGLTWLEAQNQHPQLCKQLLHARNWQPVPQAESPTTARKRAEAWVNYILHQHHPGETIWAISHAGIMQQLVAVILGCDRTWQIPIHHTARFEFWLSQTHWQTLCADRFNPEYWILRRFNDTSHLTELNAPIAPGAQAQP